jgi:ribosomal protein S18 acetylase RimI-like enzyme
MIIRTATAEDAESIARIHIETWRTSYTGIVPQAHLDKLDVNRRADGLRKILSESDRDETYLLAETDDGEALGFAAIGPNRKSGLNYGGEIYAIYVLEEYQHRGIGRLLFDESVRRLMKLGYQSMLLAVIAENSARGFYERLGGRVVSDENITIGGKVIAGVCYAWEDLRILGSITPK